jgi:UDP-N-acetylmuramyl tripeptide synthase
VTAPNRLDPRLALAIAAGKLTAGSVRRLGRGGGTTLPGRVSAAIDRRALEKLSARLPAGAVMISGTNGKTTTSTLIRRLLAAGGLRVMGNRAGANLMSGLTAAVVQESGIGGAPRADIAVFEVDEASLPHAVAAVTPRLVVITNLFRDQLDRYGELETSASAIGAALAALPAASTVLLCADDPTVAGLGAGIRAGVNYFGLDAAIGDDHLPHAADAKFCPRCGEPYVFERVYVAHMGHYRCPNGHVTRPVPHFRVTRVDFQGLRGQVVDVEGPGMAETSLEVPLSGLYNTYNVVAAVAAATNLGVPVEKQREALRGFRPAFGRLESVDVGGRTIRLMLAKNPASFNEVLRASTLLGDGKRFLVAVNDRIADGRDVSWIWDVDFELLNPADWIVLGGSRALDMRIRLKYGGRQTGALMVAEEPAAALDACIARSAPGDEIFVLPTYTAMLDLRAELVRRGHLQPFWEQQ